jgi:two-component system, cell cycle sensor histidine kinase and response regulator CckA
MDPKEGLLSMARQKSNNKNRDKKPKARGIRSDQHGALKPLDKIAVLKDGATPKDEHDFLNQIVNHLPLGMFCKDYSDDSGKFIAWNAFAESLFGLKKEQVIGKSDADFFPPEQLQHFRQKDLETLTTGKLLYVEEEYVDSPSLGRRVVRTWKVPIQGKFLLGISQDISVEKKLSEDLSQQKALAYHQAKLASLGEMAGGMAHEINNPLAILAGLTSKLSKLYRGGKLTDQEEQQLTKNIQDTIGRIRSIVNSLQKISRNDVNEDLVTITMYEALKDLALFHKDRLQTVGIQMTYDFSSSPSHLDIRPSQLAQVVANLIANSERAVSKLNAKWINIHSWETDNTVVIAVTDAGTGIAKEIQDRIFDPFFTTSDIGQGAGLGLSVCKGLIESQSGKIYLDRSSKNTRFVIELPKTVSKKGAA